MHNQHLSVHTSAGTNTNNRNRQFGSILCSQSSRNFFQYDCETTNLFQQMSICDQFLRFRFLTGTNRICPEFINGLRRQSQMTHDRNTRTQNTFDRFPNFRTSFKLNTIRMRFLHHTDGRSQRFFRVTLIRPERQIHDNQGTLYRFHDRFTMIDHLVKRDRQCCYITSHYVGSRIAHQYNIHTGLID